jgi:hypothetical protein
MRDHFFAWECGKGFRCSSAKLKTIEVAFSNIIAKVATPSAAQ